MDFIVIFIFALVLIKLVKLYASVLGLMDIPNERSVHKRMTPRSAGIGIYLSVAITLAIFHFELIYDYLWTIVAIFIVFIIGVLDDHHDTSPNTKFLVLIVATIFLSLNGIVITDIGTYFGVCITLGWLSLPFTVFSVVGFTNALNLIDGLDGLAGTISIIIFATFFFIGYRNNDIFIMLFSGAFIAGLLAFLVYNWHPASIFMGDSGSLTLGFVISVLAIKSLAYLPAISIFFIAAIPILDTFIVMIRRKRNGKSMFAPDKCHIHHILKQLFAHNTPKTVIFLGILQAIYSLIGLQLDKEMDDGYLLVLFVLNVILLYLLFEALIKRQKRTC